MNRLILWILLLLTSFPMSAQTHRYDGIDLSHHNGTVNWRKIKQNRDIEFVYLKATEGKTYTDPCYRRNIRNARAHGVKVGSYHYFRMTSGATEQFENLKRVIRKNEQDLIPMIDVETTDNHQRAPHDQKSAAESCTDLV